MLVVKAEQAANARKRQGSTKKKAVREAENFLEQLKRLVRDSEDEGDFVDGGISPPSEIPATPRPTPRPTESNSPSPSRCADEQIRAFLARIFNCSICLTPAKLPAAACSTCKAVIGCVPCIEQWYESSPGSDAKCPLCRTTAQYKLVPILREIATIFQQPLPEDQSQSDNESAADTIPYIDAQPDDTESDEDLPVGLVE